MIKKLPYRCVRYGSFFCFVGLISPCRVRKRTRYKPPAMRVRDDGYTKKSPTSV